MDQFTDSVNTSVKEMYELLDEIWLSVGYSQEERGQILDQILIDIDSLCLQKLEEEQKARESIKEDLLRTKDAIEDICQRMGQEAPDVDAIDEESSLLDQLETLNGMNDDLLKASEERRERSSYCKENIQLYMDKLGETETSVDLTCNLLTAEFIEELEQALASLEEKAQQRQNDMEGIATESYDTITMLGITVDDMTTEAPLLRMHGMSDEEEEVCPPALQKQLLQPITDWGTSQTFSFGLTFETFDALFTFNQALTEEKKCRSEQLKELGAQIQKLWRLLVIPREEQEAFSSSCTQLGLSMVTIEKGEEELSRLQVLKREKMADVVSHVRTDIESLWDELRFGDEQRQQFEPFHKNAEDVSDEEFEAHQEELARLQALMEQMAPMLRKINIREEILRERDELDELQKDPTRLQARGPNATEMRKKEEVMTKHVRSLGKLTTDIQRRVEAWESEQGELIVNGERYLDTIERVEMEYEARKEEERKARLDRRKGMSSLSAPKRSMSSSAPESKRRSRKPLSERN
jgi:hypothetical protein